MRVLKLVAENVKKLRAIEITPSGDLVEITGRNGQGKSSVLDSLWWALAGAKHIQAMPIRQGENRARIVLDLGELIVERRFTPHASTVTVTSADGARFGHPQSMLDALLGALAFDPLAFVHQGPRQQFETLREIVELDVDVEALDRQSQIDYDRRTELNRDAKAKRAQADGVDYPVTLPAEPIDAAAIKDRMAGAAEYNAGIEAERARRERMADQVSGLRENAEDRRAKAAALRKEAEILAYQANDMIDEAEQLVTRLAEMEPLPDPVDVHVLRQALDRAETTNRGIEARDRQRALNREASAIERDAQDLTERIESRNQAKAAAFARAQMPVPGLGFGEGIITFDGVPFDQASTAEQLRVSVAIAMAMNPKLRVLRIKEGSLLDADSLALVAALAREHDYQVWVERVDSSGRVGIVIEDGEVASVHHAAAPA